MMGVKFGAYHSRTNFGLDYLHKEIESPEPKYTTVNIPLVHGDLDLTERLTGPDPVFNTRKLTFNFEMRSMRSSWITDHADIMSKLHGRILNVELDEDPGYYWRGRVTVGPIEDHGFTAGIQIQVDAFPFKWSKTPELEGSYTLSGGSTTITISITSIIAKPVFDFALLNNVEVTYNNQVFVASPTIKTPPGLLFKKGNNQSLILKGSGAVMMDVYGGVL